MTVVDLYAGARGWEADPESPVRGAIGVELDAAAAATSRAAGFQTVEADVLNLAPHAFGDVTGLLGSPPCQRWSMQGKGASRSNMPAILAAVQDVAAGRTPDLDPLDRLVLEPLRWALELEPEWVALEQVPTVLPVWQACAAVLRADGYHAVAGIVNAEQFGVAQTRKRAVLLAARWPVALPTPTHSRFHLRNPSRVDPGLPKWVSIAEALEWPRRRTIGEAPAAERWVLAAGTRPRASTRGLDEPAPTIAFGHDRNSYAFKGEGDDLVEAKAAGRAIPLGLDDAARLQSFPAGYPWQGTEGKRYRQVANAIPPTLATACLRALGLAAAAPLEAAA